MKTMSEIPNTKMTRVYSTEWLRMVNMNITKKYPQNAQTHLYIKLYAKLYVIK